MGKWIIKTELLHTFELELDDIMELDTEVGDAGVSVCWGDELIELENDCELLYEEVVFVVMAVVGALYVQTILRSLELCRQRFCFVFFFSFNDFFVCFMSFFVFGLVVRIGKEQSITNKI